MQPQRLPPPLRAVRPARIQTDGSPPAPRPDPGEVIAESPVTLDVQGVGAFTLMATPVETRALAVGFLFTEDIIAGLDDLLLLEDCAADPGVLRIQVAEGASKGAAGRSLLVASSCGLCGARGVEEMLERLPAVGRELAVRPAALRGAVRAMRRRQELFRRTGGAHAAALFGADGELATFAEDIGRHNALDKAIGASLLEGRSPRGHGAALSGRVSLEMVAKCARGGIELIAAVSAPTSLALDAAERCGITLCAFVRETRATVYTHPERVRGAA